MEGNRRTVRQTDKQTASFGGKPSTWSPPVPTVPVTRLTVRQTAGHIDNRQTARHTDSVK